MEIVFIIAILLAFILGAYIRQPFSFDKEEIEKKEITEPTEKEIRAAKRAVTQFENMMNAGNPNYKQQPLEDD